MRTLFVGDVHGCANTLRKLLEKARADRVILVGDLFAKGHDPAGVWELIRDYRAEAVRGNHDQRLLDAWGTDGKSAHHQCYRLLDDEARAWTSALPLFLHGEDWTCVHAGVHPTLGVEGTDARTAMFVRRWPDDKNLDNPFWWQLYTGTRSILYGHDAVRGLQLHDYTFGLDSGCTYGRELTGLIWEEREILQEGYCEEGPPRAIG